MTYSVWAIACIAASAAFASAFDIGIQSCKPGTWAVTFDDGPAQFTPTVLKHLSDAGVQATFFVIGKQLEDPTNVKYLQDAFAAGHQIAGHSYNHTSLNSLDEAALTKDMQDTQDKIVEAIGMAPSYMRPPFGECSTECAAVLEKMGLTPTMWNIDSRDWTHAPSGENADQILEDTKRYLDGKGPIATPTDAEGVISLAHDIHGFSVDRLPQILAYIKEQGFQMTTVADCAADGRPAPYKNADATATTPAVESAVPDVAPSVDGPDYSAPDSTGKIAYDPIAATSAVPSFAPTWAAEPTSASDSGADGAAAQPTDWATPASGTGSDSSSSSDPSASPNPTATDATATDATATDATATDAASPSPAVADNVSSAAASDTVGSILGELQSGGVVSRPGLLVSLVAPAAALLGFARML